MKNYQYNNLAIEQFNNRKGITLIELVMVIVIVGILAGASSMYIKETIDLWRFLTFRNEVVSGGRMALARMAREIRQMDEAEVAQTDSLQFLDINGSRLRFRRTADNNLWRDVDSNLDDIFEAQDVLATGVSELDFSYYDKDNNQLLEPVSDPSQIYRINIELEIESGDQTKTLRSQIYPRNL
jgi:prepilin-type N-terminal cleavage/methylation domain-containing protein